MKRPETVSGTGTPAILTIGNFDSVEMRPLRESLARQVSAGGGCSLREQSLLAPRADHPAADLRRASTLEAATDLVPREQWFPDLVIVCQHWPDEFPAPGFERLLTLLPLARWVCCCGAWCESDGRNRTLWPLAIRATARTIDVRLTQELAVLRGEAPPLPLTASRDETFEHDATSDLPDFNGRTVRIVSPDPAYRALLRDLVRASGGQACASDDDAPDVVLWDVDPWTPDRLAAMPVSHSNAPRPDIIALMGLPHPEDVDALHAHGVRTVLTKLTTLQQLARLSK